MTTTTLPPIDTLTSAPSTSPLAPRMWSSRIIGGLFLAGFITYGAGSALVTTVVGDDDFLSSVPHHETVLALGVVLMLMNTLIDVGKAVVFFPIVERYDRRTALVYLSAMIVEVALMSLGALALLMTIPLAREAGRTGSATDGWANGLGNLAVDANELAYQTGQLMLASGALFLVALLLRSGLVPRWLAVLGIVGYALHLTGSTAELFGLHISLFLLVPGALFEVGIAFWLIVKGFDPVAYRGPATKQGSSLAS